MSTEAALRVSVDGEYGLTDGQITLSDELGEIVTWDSAEWTEDPSLVYVIAHAIHQGVTLGPQHLRALQRPGPGATTSGGAAGAAGAVGLALSGTTETREM